MSLVDTTENILMLGAYSWAFVKPIRKLHYNMTITFVSAIIALAVGGIEALGLFAGESHGPEFVGTGCEGSMRTLDRSGISLLGSLR